ncbi:MAG: hypothetical protein HYW06_06070 [Gemmatimonadetes bacterium]|nr:hypothetical protein [Gemmatimonadota bacterium]
MHPHALKALLAFALLWPATSPAQDLPESSPRALMHHAQGVEAYVDTRYEEAIRHFVLAYEADPTSFVSLLMAGVSAGNALSAYYRYRLEAQMANRAGNLDGYIAANRQAAALGRGTKASYNVAQGVIQVGRANEARESLRQLDPDREPMKGWINYYGVYANAAHQLGDHEDELQMARRARTGIPDIRGAQLEAEALAALGRTAEAEQVLAVIQTMPPFGQLTPGEVMTTVAQEFGAHGDAAAATRWLENALRWFDALPADAGRTADNRGDKAYALYSLGRYREAATIHQGLAAELPNVAVWKAWAGYDAALTGDKAKGTEVANQTRSRCSKSRGSGRGGCTVTPC